MHPNKIGQVAHWKEIDAGLTGIAEPFLIVTEEGDIMVADNIQPWDLELITNIDKLINLFDRTGINGVTGMDHKIKRPITVQSIGCFDLRQIYGPVEIFLYEIVFERGYNIVQIMTNSI